MSSAHAVLPEARSCPASSSQTTHGVTQRERGRALRRGNAPPLSPSTATPTVSTPIPDAVHAHAHCPQDALDHCPGCGLLPRATLLTRGLPCPLHSASPPAWSKTALLAKAAGRAGRPASLRGCPTALATEARPCAFGVRHACNGDRDPVARGRQRRPPASPETAHSLPGELLVTVPPPPRPAPVPSHGNPSALRVRAMWRSSDCPAVATAAPQTPGCRLRPGRVMARAPGQASRAGPCTPALWWPTASTRSTPGAPPKPGLSPSPAAAAPSSPGPDL